ncbi:2'-5' RNA ligase family protein [Mucilaginibacter sp. PAMB04274]|uniref:2'-5' RNA ligase family protein n=1 Tax=Mucilaginibacter sp. PAMB04274 TaxID=3138568 RepID=UPI0031F71242
MLKNKDVLFILEPSDTLTQKVAAMKTEVANTIGSYESRYSKAHITLWDAANLSPYLIDHLISVNEKYVRAIRPQTLVAGGLNSFSEKFPYTVFIPLEETSTINKWFNELYNAIRHNKRTPHITIARGLQLEQRHSIFRLFKDFKINESFTPNGITVLVRDTFDHNSHWKPHKTRCFNQ